MTQGRYTKAMAKAGITSEMHGYIYYKLMNMKYNHKEFNRFVVDCCKTVAGEDWAAVYEFITNSSINHVYIYNKYRIQKNLLYAWKRKIYVMIAEAIRGGVYK